MWLNKKNRFIAFVTDKAIVAAMLGILAGAYPSISDLARSFIMDVKVKDVKVLMRQAELVVKNTDCIQNSGGQYNMVASNNDSMVGSMVCESGDTHIMVLKNDGSPPHYWWVSFDTVSSGIDSVSGLFNTEAFADVLPMVKNIDFKNTNILFSTESGVRNVRVICRYRRPGGVIYRRVQLPNGSCYDEWWDRYGRIFKWQPAPCRNC